MGDFNGTVTYTTNETACTGRQYQDCLKEVTTTRTDYQNFNGETSTDVEKKAVDFCKSYTCTGVVINSKFMSIEQLRAKHGVSEDTQKAKAPPATAHPIVNESFGKKDNFGDQVY